LEIVKTILSNHSVLSHDLINKFILDDFLINDPVDILIVSWDCIEGNQASIRGFACLNVRNSFIKIEVICCAKRHTMARRRNIKYCTGKNIMKMIENIARQYGIQQIYLDSIIEAVHFYLHLGYQFPINNKFTLSQLFPKLKTIREICTNYPSNYDKNTEFQKILNYLDRLIHGFYSITKLNGIRQNDFEDVDSDDEIDTTLKYHVDFMRLEGYKMIKNIVPTWQVKE